MAEMTKLPWYLKAGKMMKIKNENQLNVSISINRWWARWIIFKFIMTVRIHLKLKGLKLSILLESPRWLN